MRRVKFFRAREGVAAIEFALSLFILLPLLFGGFEVSRYILIVQKTEKVAATMADLVTQSTSISIAGLDNLLFAAGQVMEPYPFGSNGLVVITSVYKPADTPPQIVWVYTGGGSLVPSKPQTVAPASLPGGLTLSDNENVIVVQVYYDYTPALAGTFMGAIFSPTEIYRVVVYKPRLGLITTPPT